MQLARNVFLTQKKTIMRKLEEFLWAVQIERKYSKDEILEAYLNEFYLNHGGYTASKRVLEHFSANLQRS